MSESKQNSAKSFIMVRAHRRAKGKNKENKQTVQTDWSLVSGRIPYMNQPNRDNQVHRFVETYTWDTITSSSNAVAVATGLSFTLSTLSDASQYVALFDQYRIDLMEVWIMPQSQNLTALMKSVIDYDNITTTATDAYFDNYSNCHTTTMANGHYRRFVPHLALAAYGGGAFTSYANLKPQWIDCASATVAHYGIKFLTEVTAAGAIGIDVLGRFHLSFRNKI